MLQETSIFFSGAKLFQSTKSNLKVTIVDFASFGCMELIVYDPVQKMEAPRIYLNKNLWNSKIKQNEVNKKMAIEIEFLNRKRQKFDKEQLLLKTIYKLTVKYIISRLNYGKCLKEGEFRVELTPGFTDLIDKSTHKLDIVQMRPIELTPFAIKHEDDEGEDADNEEQTECEKEGDGLGHGLHIVTNGNASLTKQLHSSDEKHEKQEKSVRKQHRAHSIMNNYTIFMDEEVMQGSGVADLGGVVHTGINTICEVDASTALDGSKHAAGGNKIRTKRMSVARRNSVINFVHNGESELAQLFDALTLEKGGLKSNMGSRAASPISSPMIFRVGSKDAVNNISPGKTTGHNDKSNSNSPNNTTTFDNQTSKQAATAAAKAFGLHTNTNSNNNSNNPDNGGSEDSDSSVSSYDSGTEVPDKFVRHVNRKSLMAAKYDSSGHLVAPQMTAQQIAQLENQKLLDDLYHENNKQVHSTSANGKKKSPTTSQQQKNSPKNNANLLPTLHTNHPRSPLNARLPIAK